LGPDYQTLSFIFSIDPARGRKIVIRFDNLSVQIVAIKAPRGDGDP